MRISTVTLLFLTSTNAAFVPTHSRHSQHRITLKGYLDDLNKDITSEDEDVEVDDSHAATDMQKENIDRFGAGTFENFVDFEEFDGGDGQMGVAGDGSKGLEKLGSGPSFATSKFRSAKNAWGSSTGYADELREKGVETSRAQQLENWANQRELYSQQQQKKYMTEEFDKVTAEEDWRTLSKFGVERNQEFDLSETLGSVLPGTQLEGIIELSSRTNLAAVYEFQLKNEYMGFADFRAAFTDGTGPEWTISPNEGSLSSKSPVDFTVKFRPQGPGTFEGFLVIDTEDMKKTWKLIGTTS